MDKHLKNYVSQMQMLFLILIMYLVYYIWLMLEEGLILRKVKRL